jgi:ABC-type Na+ efflux pump permease subunit
MTNIAIAALFAIVFINQLQPAFAQVNPGGGQTQQIQEGQQDQSTQNFSYQIFQEQNTVATYSYQPPVKSGNTGGVSKVTTYESATREEVKTSVQGQSASVASASTATTANTKNTQTASTASSQISQNNSSSQNTNTKTTNNTTTSNTNSANTTNGVTNANQSLSASVSNSESIFPNTFLEWLVLAILVFIIVGFILYIVDLFQEIKKKQDEEAKRRANGNGNGNHNGIPLHA